MIPAERGRFQVEHSVPGHGSEPKVHDVLAWADDGKPMVIGTHGLSTFTGSATGSWKVIDRGPTLSQSEAILARNLLLRLFGTQVVVMEDHTVHQRPDVRPLRLSTDEMNMLLDMASPAPGEA